MAERIISTVGLDVGTHADGLADAGTLELTGGDASTGTGEATGVVHGGDCDIDYVIVDAGGSDLITVTLKSPTGSGLTPLNPPIPCNENRRSRVRVTNTSGGAADYAILGYEVD